MGGGHERSNPRGSPTGKKERGDKLAEKVHGRKGMYKKRRKKEAREIPLGGGGEIPDLTPEELLVLTTLTKRGVFRPPGMPLSELVFHFDSPGITPESIEGIAGSLARKYPAWVKASHTHICLEITQRDAIRDRIGFT